MRRRSDLGEVSGAFMTDLQALKRRSIAPTAGVTCAMVPRVTVMMECAVPRRNARCCRCGRAASRGGRWRRPCTRNDAAARPHQAAAGLRHRGRGDGAECARDDVGPRRHAVRRHAATGNVYAVTLPRQTAGAKRRCACIASGLREPAGVAFRNGALYVSAVEPHPALRRHRARLDASAAAGGRHRCASPTMARTAGSSSPSVPTASCTCRSARRATSASPIRDVRDIMRIESRRQRRSRSFARGVRNTVGFDWHPQTQRALVHRQRPRHAGRRRPARRAQPRAAGRHAFRLSRIATAARSPIRSSAPKRLQRVRAAGAEARPARRGARHAVLHGHAVSRRRTATRSSSPSTARGTAASKIGYRVIARHARRERQGDRRTSRSPKAGCRAEQRVGPARRRARRCPTARCSCRDDTRGRDLPDQLQAVKGPRTTRRDGAAGGGRVHQRASDPRLAVVVDEDRRSRRCRDLDAMLVPAEVVRHVVVIRTRAALRIAQRCTSCVPPPPYWLPTLAPTAPPASAPTPVATSRPRPLPT